LRQPREVIFRDFEFGQTKLIRSRREVSSNLRVVHNGRLLLHTIHKKDVVYDFFSCPLAYLFQIDP